MNSDLSDDEAPPISKVQSVEQLEHENKMKEIALSKATNLIELLNIELEVEKNGQQESLRLLEEELMQQFQQQLQRERSEHRAELERVRRQYEGEVKRLKDSNGELAREIHRKQSSTNTTLRTMTRSMSSASLSKRRSVNKKYTEAATLESAEGGQSVSASVYQQHMMEVEDWKERVVTELNAVVQSEYDELGEMIGGIEALGSDCQEFVRFAPKRRCSADATLPLWKIIKEQQSLINALRIHSQEITDLLSSMNHRLSNATPLCEIAPFLSQDMQAEGIARSIRGRVSERVAGWMLGRAEQEGEREQRWATERDRLSQERGELQEQVGSLQAENGELKGIIEDMIGLVRRQRQAD